MYLQSSEQFVKVDDLSILDIVVPVCLSVCILFFFMFTWVVNKRMYVLDLSQVSVHSIYVKFHYWRVRSQGQSSRKFGFLAWNVTSYDLGHKLVTSYSADTKHLWQFSGKSNFSRKNYNERKFRDIFKNA